MRNKFCLFYFLFLALIAKAQTTPEGLWLSFDDDGKTPTALVRIAKENGQLSGRIEKVLYAQTGSETVCTHCRDDRKNQAMVGLEIIRGAKVSAQDDQWRDGKILDPDDGEVYRLVMTLAQGGQVLEVKGYWGLFWRTQHWRRQSP